MPERMERALKEEARKRGYTGRRAAAFVYGIMRSRGWKPEVKWKKHKGQKSKPHKRK